MSDNGEVEVENPSAGYPVLPKDVVNEIGSVKLFNKWCVEQFRPSGPSNVNIVHPGHMKMWKSETSH